jgi:hypothetical protein
MDAILRDPIQGHSSSHLVQTKTTQEGSEEQEKFSFSPVRLFDSEVIVTMKVVELKAQ